MDPRAARHVRNVRKTDWRDNVVDQVLTSEEEWENVLIGFNALQFTKCPLSNCCRAKTIPKHFICVRDLF